MMYYKILIEYRDGTIEERYVESYSATNGCLNLSNRFGEYAGESHIPLDRIKEYKVTR